MIQVTESPIQAGKVFERLSREGAGSLVVHLGVVKPVVDDRQTRGIRLAPEGDLEGEMQKIESRLREQWRIVDVLLIRRVGELRVGDVILAAAVSATTKDAAFGACQEAVEVLKQKRGLRKEELYE
jgi:molybdopterin synthase catalytic subunit